MIGPDVRFCPRCGAPAFQTPPTQGFAPGYAPTVPSRTSSPPRVTRNLQALGILWFVYGAYRVIGGLIGMFVLRAVTMRGFGGRGWPFNNLPSQLPSGWMAFLIPVIGTVTVVSAVLAFLTGYSLLSRRPWGRTLAIVAAALALFKLPLGTALGIYTLWVLAPAESGTEYEAITAETYGV